MDSQSKGCDGEWIIDQRVISHHQCFDFEFVDGARDVRFDYSTYQNIDISIKTISYQISYQNKKYIKS